ALLSGFVNGGGSLTMRATALAKDSAASRLLELAEHAARQKSGGERFLLRFAKIYTPAVMALGALLAVAPSLLTGDWATWVPRGLLFLVSACPCAVVLSVPLGFFAAIGGAARRGVLVKGGRYVEILAKAETAVFDKTGTLTTSNFEITEIAPCGGVSRERLLAAAALAEQASAHPFAKAILAASPAPGITPERIEELPGGGVIATAGGREILCGSRRMLEARGIDLGELPAAQVYVAENGRALGAIRCESAVHPEAPQAVAQLRKLGVKTCAMLTGDAELAARHAAEQCGLDEVHAALLPEDKLARLEGLKASGAVFYVGDGVNDAPVLALADAGVAMGFGAQAACEAADAVVMGSSLLPLARARALFRKALRVTRGNVAFALIIKALVVAVGLLLPVTPVWLAVFADVGVMVITVANAGRLARGNAKHGGDAV
ncbi:MAG: cadmium-translocating P-type ATPase, partial [Oscillospiraceae bacterium]|nr:cadmium-translocating P-type ATPase [Oscillospiraceae bacterium]